MKQIYAIVLTVLCLPGLGFAYDYSDSKFGPRAYLKMTGSGNDLGDQFALCHFLNPSCLAFRDSVSISGDGIRDAAGDRMYLGGAIPVGFGAIGIAGGSAGGSLQANHDFDISYGFPLSKSIGLGAGVSSDSRGVTTGKIGGKMDFPMKKSKSDGFAFQNLKIGVAILNIGEPMISEQKNYPFTVRSSFQFQFTNWRYFKSYAQASFEGGNHFRNIYVNPGILFNVFRFVEIGAAWRAQSYLVQNTGYGLLGLNIPLLGGEAVVRYSTNLDPKSERDHLVYSQFSYMFESPHKLQKQAAEFEIPIIHFSPDGDGVKDVAIVENFKFRGEPIADWCAYVKNADGDVVRTYCSELVKNNLGLVPPPEQITWDGRTQKGAVVEDGKYSLEYMRRDVNAVVKTDLLAFLVPQTKKFDGETSLSPDAAIRNTYAVAHTTNDKREIQWRASIVNEERVILREIVVPRYQNKFVLAFSTNGIPPKDAMTARFLLTGEDKAGNIYRFERPVEQLPADIGALSISRQQTHVNLREAKPGIQVSLKTNAPLTEVRFSLHRKDGTLVKTMSTPFQSECTIIDAALRSFASGDVLWLKATGFDAKGNQYNSNSLDFLVVGETNILRVSHQPELFEQSPETSSLIRFKTMVPLQLALQSWQIEVSDERGRLFANLTGKGAAPAHIEWNGKNGEVSLEPLSSYRYVLKGVDGAGSTFASPIGELRTGIYLREPTGAEDPTNSRSVLLKIPNVLFTAGSSGIKPEFRKKLADLVRKLRLYPDYSVVVEGYTDNIGGEAYNQKLSEQRAGVIKKIFVEEGLPASQIVTIGYGQARPIADNGTEEGRARNRRVEIILSPQKKKR